MSDPELSEADERLIEEIETLKAIYSSELDISYAESGRPTLLTTTLYPATADEVSQQYVRLTLKMHFPPGYPDVVPVIEFYQPRGLSEEFLREAMQNCQLRCQEYLGSPVIFEITELLRENLTNSNRPTGRCAICLFNFVPKDVFTYTPCYHHYHSHCLLRYVLNVYQQWEEERKQDIETAQALLCTKKEKQLQCPVCREPITADVGLLKKAPPPLASSYDESVLENSEFRSWKTRMEKVYQKQKAQGGIIDCAEEESRFLIITEPCPSNETAEENLPESVPAGPSVAEPESIKPLPMKQNEVVHTTQASGRSSRGGYFSSRKNGSYPRNSSDYHPRDSKQDRPASNGRSQQNLRPREAHRGNSSTSCKADPVDEVATKLSNAKPI